MRLTSGGKSTLSANNNEPGCTVPSTALRAGSFPSLGKSGGDDVSHPLATDDFDHLTFFQDFQNREKSTNSRTRVGHTAWRRKSRMIGVGAGLGVGCGSAGLEPAAGAARVTRGLDVGCLLLSRTTGVSGCSKATVPKPPGTNNWASSELVCDGVSKPRTMGEAGGLGAGCLGIRLPRTMGVSGGTKPTVPKPPSCASSELVWGWISEPLTTGGSGGLGIAIRLSRTVGGSFCASSELVWGWVSEPRTMGGAGSLGIGVWLSRIVGGAF